ncbi:glycosyltransferase [Actinoallomurus purpureus]|uniref:glycosyltransferase n=1 Tax=Actinoallomurus purpureus TaxID=478114 RepID=UPI002092BF1F|nr:glycosyltransferase [Actinoallomurus purpureus]MCO6006798.1 glycosyltransferase [Actinoallomurus purpureus]
MRDVFIVSNSVDELGGLTRWVHHIAHLFSERGHRVHLVGVTHAKEKYDYGDDFPVTVLHDTHPPARAKGRLRELRRRSVQRKGAEKLSALFRTARPGGIVIAAQVWAMEWVALADTAGMPVIGMSHESYAASQESSRFGRVQSYFSQADRLLVLTTEDADAWARKGMSNIDVMPNPVHVTPTAFPDLTEPVVVALGRLSYEKGHDMLLESWARVAKNNPSWKLRVFGAGPMDETLRRQADELDITVDLAGMTNDVQGALTNASIYALPSRSEGFPMGILEAMAYGLPVVAFDSAPGIRELITHEIDGILVTPGNVIEFAEALERLMGDPGLRAKLGEAGRRSVQRFSADVVVDRWERMFDLVYR